MRFSSNFQIIQQHINVPHILSYEEYPGNNSLAYVQKFDAGESEVIISGKKIVDTIDFHGIYTPPYCQLRTFLFDFGEEKEIIMGKCNIIEDYSKMFNFQKIELLPKYL